jgi:hypothetical protein
VKTTFEILGMFSRTQTHVDPAMVCEGNQCAIAGVSLNLGSYLPVAKIFQLHYRPARRSLRQPRNDALNSPFARVVLPKAATADQEQRSAADQMESAEEPTPDLAGEGSHRVKRALVLAVIQAWELCSFHR